MKRVFFLLSIFIFIPVCLYLALDRENIDINEFRLNSGYEEVKLSYGITSYKDIGDKNNKVIVLVHGATFGSLAYEEYVNVFIKNNYRVITYDQYGRGYSDRIHNDVSIELMERQLKELIEHCEVEDVILYGVSFGAAVVAKYSANNPENISFIGYQVPLINSANIPLLSIVKIPLYGDLLTRGFGQFNVKGTEKFFKKFFLGNATGNRLEDHSIIGNKSIPSYFVYAEDDIEIDSRLVEEAIKQYQNPIVKKYSGGHFFSSGIEREVAQEFINSINN